MTFTASAASTNIRIQPTTTVASTFNIDEVVLSSASLYEAVAIMKSDYYPFGMQMPGRFINSDKYRYGYNGMEKDNELKGIGNSYTTEFRQYDPRLGRWLSLDPLMMQFPWMSPYVAFDDNPVLLIDPMGLAAQGGEDKGGKKKPREKEYTLVGGEKISLPKSANVKKMKDYDKNGVIGHKDGTRYKGTKKGDVAQFTDETGETYNATYDKDGNFKGYYTVDGDGTRAKYIGEVRASLDTRSDADFIPDLEIRMHSSTAGISVGALGGEAGIGWNYLQLMPGKGWWEQGANIYVNGISPSAGSGTALIPIKLRDLVSAEVLSIGGGTLTIDEDYWKAHPTRSLQELLANKSVQVITGVAALKVVNLQFMDADGVIIATGNIYSFALSKPGASISGDSYDFKQRTQMTTKDSVKVARRNSGTPSFNNYLRSKGKR